MTRCSTQRHIIFSKVEDLSGVVRERFISSRPQLSVDRNVKSIFKILTAVSERTHRCFFKLINVKTSTVLHFNVIAPLTAVVWPVVTDFASHFATPHRRMASAHPSWSVRTTATLIWTCSWHPVTSCTSETIPAFAEIFLVTPYWVLTNESHKTVRWVKNVVMFARVKYCRDTSIKNTSVIEVGED